MRRTGGAARMNDATIINLSCYGNAYFRTRLQMPAWFMAREGVEISQVTLQGQVRTMAAATGAPVATFGFGPIDQEGYFDVTLPRATVAGLTIEEPYAYDIVATEPDDGDYFVTHFGLFAVAAGVTVYGAPAGALDIPSVLLILGAL